MMLFLVCLLLFSVFTCFWFCLHPQCLTWFLFCGVPSSLICYYQQTFQSNFPLKSVRQISHLPSPSRLSCHPKCQDHQCALFGKKETTPREQHPKQGSLRTLVWMALWPALPHCRRQVRYPASIDDRLGGLTSSLARNPRGTSSPYHPQAWPRRWAAAPPVPPRCSL